MGIDVQLMKIELELEVGGICEVMERVTCGPNPLQVNIKMAQNFGEN